MAAIQPIEDLYPVHPRFVNHDFLHCTAEVAEGDYLSSGRALGITTPYDIIQLHRDLMDDFPAISEHYDRVGLSYTDRIIWNLRLEELENYPHYEVSYFCFGEQQHKVARHENWFRVVDYIKSKNGFMDLARLLGMQTPNTLCFHDVAQLDRAALAKIRYPCYLKTAIPGPGEGVFYCKDKSSLVKSLAAFGDKTPFQIQDEIRATAFLNLQYQVVGSRLERLAVTELTLNNVGVQGNCHPTPHNAWYSVEPMAKWLFCQGMRGIFAFDVAVIEDACGTDYIPMGCKPRFTSVSYPTLIADKLGIPRWQTRVFYTRYRKIADLPIRDVEFNPYDQTGIVLVNWGTIQVGMVTILLAGTPEKQTNLQETLIQRL